MKTAAQEKNHTDSCLNSANPDELVFVITARDAAARETLYAWAGERVRLGLNNAEDEQIKDALETAEAMREQLTTIRALIGKAPRHSEEALVLKDLIVGDAPAPEGKTDAAGV